MAVTTTYTRCLWRMSKIVGSILFVFLLGFLVFFTWSLNQGPKQVIEQVFDVTILDSVSMEEAAGPP